jgi:hypothetical protein
VISELFALGLWAVTFLRLTAHIAFHAQSVKLAPVMTKIRQGLVPAALFALGLGSFSQAHGMPGPLVQAGSNLETQYIEPSSSSAPAWCAPTCRTRMAARSTCSSCCRRTAA